MPVARALSVHPGKVMTAHLAALRSSARAWVRQQARAVATVFGRFEPKVVGPAVDGRWQVTSRDDHNYEQGLTAEGPVDVWSPNDDLGRLGGRSPQWGDAGTAAP